MTEMSFFGHKILMPTYLPSTAWLRHGPFATWLVQAARPRKLVELGTHSGFSYFSFCQAIKTAKLDTQCYAVDTWRDEEHAGFHGEDIFKAVQKENEKYDSFSFLIRKRFEEALGDVEDGTVDILHVDNLHLYNDVKEVFESWTRKLSDRAIVLFHKTEVKSRDFGVWKYWDELKNEAESLNFPYQNGLGVLFWGNSISNEVKSFREAIISESGKELIVSLFHGYGEVLAKEVKIKDLQETSKNRGPVRSLAEARASARLLEQRDFLEKQLMQALDQRSIFEKKLVQALPPSLKPWKDYASYTILMKIIASGIPLSERTRSRLERSARKRAAYTKSTVIENNLLDLNISENPSKLLSGESIKGSALTEIGRVDALAFEAINLERKYGFAVAHDKFVSLDKLREETGEKIESSLLISSLIKKRNPSTQGPTVSPSDYTRVEFRKDKIVVYTALFGNYDQLPAIHTDRKGIEFVCFTDQDIEVSGWRIEKRPSTSSDRNRSAKFFKLNPHKLFPTYEFSLFVDSNTLFMGRIDNFIARWLLHNKFVMWRHPERDDIYDEAEAIILLEKDNATIVCEQMMNYEVQDVPFRAGLYECSFIWRSHHDQEVIALMEAWWQEISKFSRRDQISFYFLAHTMGPKPFVLPPTLGTSRKNSIFSKFPHQPRLKPSERKLEGKPQVTFLYDGDSASSGSTYMRSIQLPNFLSERIGDDMVINHTSNVEAVRNSCVIIGKRAIKSLTVDDLHRLKKENIALIADPVDAVISQEKLDEFDFVFAASLCALERMKKSSPNTACSLLTHHADPRIPTFTAPSDELHVGYFGETQNTVGHDKLSHLIDFHLVSTRFENDAWIHELKNYNAHYAVRQSRPIDGFKPFTKGFVAAKCQSIVLCERDVGDNKYYLGEDYPFYIPSVNLVDIEDFLAELQSSFGSPSWLYALEIMKSVRHRSSEEWITGEFRAVISEIWGK